jgi:hypothetical protein
MAFIIRPSRHRNGGTTQACDLAAGRRVPGAAGKVLQSLIQLRASAVAASLRP